MTVSRLLGALLATCAGALTAPAAALAVDPVGRIGITTSGPVPDKEKVTARMTVRDDGRTHYRGRIGIEVRGQSSQLFPKKAYSVELRDRDASLLGLPANDDWVLYAAYNDKTLMRNVLAYETARGLGRYASRTRWVELTLDGRYHGVYVLMEKLELGGERIDLPKPAQLLEWTFRFQADRKGGRAFKLPRSGYSILFEDPEKGDLEARRRTQVRRSVVRAEQALYARRFRDPAAGWRRHIDEPAAIDYLLLNELFKNQDAFHASTYLTQAAGGRWALGPIWDFDIAMGNSTYGPSARLKGSMLARRAWARRFYRDPALVAGMAARWQALRAGGLRERLLDDVERHAQRLASTGSAGRNFHRWPVLGVQVWPNRPAAMTRNTYGSEVRALRGWLVRRVAWMDANVGRLGR